MCSSFGPPLRFRLSNGQMRKNGWVNGLKLDFEVVLDYSDVAAH